MSESASAEKLEKIASQVRRMLAEADALEAGDTSIYATEGASDEAATAARIANLRAMAEKFTRQYRIEEEQLIAEDSFSIVPIVRDIKISTYISDFYQNHWALWAYSCAHVGAMTDDRWAGADLVARVVGYASDIRLAEGLYQTAWMTMVAQLEPKVDPRLSDPENVYRLRNAGFERNRIAKLLWDAPEGKAGHAAHAKVGKLYAMACAERGEEPLVAGKGINKMVYRERYAESFVHRYAARLRAARDAVDSQQGAVALHGREQRVKEAFWAEFPERHPDAQKAARERWEAEQANLPAPKERKLTKEDRRRYERNYRSAAASAGSAAGRAAADKIEIGRTTEPAKRVSQAPERKSSSSAIELGN